MVFRYVPFFMASSCLWVVVYVRTRYLNGLRMLVKSLGSWYVGDTQNETMDRMAGA